jgi:flagellar basal-body rod modification protein FlgD
MAGITATSAASQAASEKKKSSTDAINDIDLGTFLTLMIKELQNQDPLNPLDNKDMLAQISQIREVGATDKLTETLDSVLLGQNITSATNLIGAQVSAISDEGEKVVGLVDSISIDKGSPKLKVENPTGVVPSSAEGGNIEAGLYSYRVVWEDDGGNLFGMDFDKTIRTTGDEGYDKAIQISNLPTTSGQKQIYRTNGTGEGAYQLVGTIDGKKASFVDKLSDSERSATRLTRSFSRSAISARTYNVSLNNVSEVQPPPRTVTPTQPSSEEDETTAERGFRPPARTAAL